MSSSSRKHRNDRRLQAASVDARSFAHHLISAQLNIVCGNEKDILKGSVTALHDMRVAIRRIRTLLTTFGKQLRLPGARKLEERFDRLQKDLGPARDTDVLLRIMEKEIDLEDEAILAGQATVLQHLTELRKRYRRDVRNRLRSKPYERLKADTIRFMNQESRASPHAGDKALGKIARESLSQALDRMNKRSHLSRSFPADKVHRFRIATRKARYLAEFFSPVLGHDSERLAHQLRELQDVLGDIHDIDVLVAGIRREYASPPKALMKELKKRRHVRIRGFSNTWEKFSRPRFKKRVSRLLSLDS